MSLIRAINNPISIIFSLWFLYYFGTKRAMIQQDRPKLKTKKVLSNK